MSKFFSDKYSSLVPYTPGEQPQDKKYVKLNTNESPFPPSQAVAKAVEEEAGRLQFYSDPECVALRKKAAEVFGINDDEIIMTNGSDEVLNFAFMAFADEKKPLRFADITYGFYPVFAELNHIPYTEIPLKEDFTLDPNDYMAVNETVVIANPNAPTGLALGLEAIEEIIKSNPDNVEKYDNLLVTGTFSKSRSMAGARLGFGIGSAKLIADLNTVKYSTNPYNVNRLTAAAGIAALEENGYYMNNCKRIQENRAWTTAELEKLGFTVLPSKANFIFAKSDKIGGEELYLTLKEKGILIRHFTKERICDYNRITIGTAEQMKTFIDAVKEIID